MDIHVTTLRSEAARGVKWTALSSAALLVVHVAQLAALGRLLTLADFGLMAMVSVVVGFAYVFVDAGLSNAVIFRQHSSGNVLSTLYWTNVAVGVTLAATLWFASPLVASFFREPAVAELLRLAALVLLIVAFGQLPQALLQRDLAFNRIAPIEIASAVIGMAVAVLAAVLGQGARSFVWGQIAAAALRSVGLVVANWSSWRPSLHFRRSELQGYAGFGAFQLGERSVNYWAASIDYLLVGRFLGPVPLGPYTVAYQLAVVPLARFNPILTRVAFPILAKTQADSAKLMRGYLQLVKAVAFLSFPLLAGLALCAQWAVPVLLGPKWLEAVPLVQVLCIMGAIKVLGNTSGSLLLAKGRADVGFWWNVFTAVVTASCLLLVLALTEAVMMVAIAQAVLSVLFLGLMLVVLSRAVGLSASSFLGASLRPGLATGLMTAALAPVLLVLHTADLPSAAALLFCVAVGAVAYATAWRFLEKGYLLGMLRQFIGSRRGAV